MASIKFTRHVQPLKCPACGKRTTNYELSTLALDLNGRTKTCVCMDCYDAAGIENEHADGHHNDKPCDDCPDCNIERQTAPKEKPVTTANRKPTTRKAAKAAKETPVKEPKRKASTKPVETDIEADDEAEVAEAIAAAAAIEEAEEAGDEADEAPAKKAKVLDPRVAKAKAKAEEARLAHAEAVKALAAAKAARKATLAALMAANAEWAEATRKVRMDRAAAETGKAADELVPA